MKISSDPSHSAFHEAAGVCRVFLEGAERCNVVTADEEGRCAVTLRLDDFGNPMSKAGKLLTDTFYGSVRIECPQWLRDECERPELRERCVDLVYGTGAVQPAGTLTYVSP